MKNDVKEELLKLPTEQIIDALVDLSSQDDVARKCVERLLSTKKDNQSRFKEHLAQIRHRSGRAYFREPALFSQELSDLLNDLKSGSENPNEDLKLIGDFYRSDAQIFDQTDDSNGDIGDVFRYQALELLIDFASKCENRQYAIKSIFDLMADNKYGARDEIIHNVHKFLTKDEMRQLFSLFQKNVSETEDFEWELKSLAKQMCDPELFESLSIQGIESKNPIAIVDVSEVYFLAKNLKKAQEFLNIIKDHATYFPNESKRYELQKNIYLQTGNQLELVVHVYARFRSDISKQNLDELVSIVGEDKREEYVRQGVSKIMADTHWNFRHAEFLKDIDHADDLEFYVHAHLSDLDGNFYFTLLPLAKFFDEKSKFLSFVLLYRVLLLSILERGKSKYYHHAVKYLKKIEAVSPKVKFWGNFENHEIFFQKIRLDHKAKRSFWSQYDEAGTSI